jgi:autotransporter-associated beta strand protein
MLRDWVLQRFGPGSRSSGRVHRPTDRHKFRIGPQLESFEERIVPAVHVWSGAIGSNWVDAGNWSVGGSPFGDPSPRVLFPAIAATHTVDVPLFVPQPIASLEFDGSGYLVEGGNSLVFTGDTQIITRNVTGTNTITMVLDQEPFGSGANSLFDHLYDVEGQGTLDIEGKLTGASPVNILDKIGTGTLRLSAPNDYGGATDVHAGTLLMGGLEHNGQVLPSSTPMTLDAGATFDLGDGNERIGSLAGAGTVVLDGTLLTGGDGQSTTFNGTFTSVAFLVKEGKGTFTLNAPHAYSGATLAIDDGVVRLGATDVLTAPVQVEAGATLDLQSHPQALAGLAGTGSVLLGGATLTVSSSFTDGASALGGVISGTGGLNKAGPSPMIVNGANSYTGTTVVQAGTFELDGSLASSLVTVDVGAILKGTGALRDLITAGTVSPGGSSPGRLHAHNVAFKSGSALAVRLDGPSTFDQLVASGKVKLSAGAALKITLGYIPAKGDTFTILQSSKGVIGTFQGLPNHHLLKLNGHTFEIAYGTKSVVLRCVAV